MMCAMMVWNVGSTYGLALHARLLNDGPCASCYLDLCNGKPLYVSSFCMWSTTQVLTSAFEGEITTVASFR